jgi:hypothetical protein
MSDTRLPGEALYIPGSNWALKADTLAIPSTFTDRFLGLEAQMQHDGDTSDRRFIGAAVLSDEERSRDDSAVIRHARLLAAADKALRMGPGIPVLAAGEYYLQAAITDPESGLGFQNNSANMSRPMGVVLASASVEMDVMNEEDPRVAAASRETGRHIMSFLLPDHVLTADNLDGTPGVVSRFPGHQVLVAGREAVSSFFRMALSGGDGSEDAAQRRALTEKIVTALDAEKATLQPDTTGRQIA